MGIFDSIKSAIWGKAEAAEAAPTPADAPVVVAASAAAPTTTVDEPAKAPAVAVESPAAVPTPAAAPASAPATVDAPTPMAAVDIAAVLDRAVADKGQTLHWRKSVVDLMKALDLDSSLAARKELATELGYTGAKDGSAEMNIWLHKALMAKLAENGGVVPADLAD